MRRHMGRSATKMEKDHRARPAGFAAGALGAFLLVLAAPVTAAGQQQGGEDSATEEAIQRETPAPEAPYDDRLERLSEVVGSIHYLARICDNAPEKDWRTLMSELIDAETADSVRRARLTAAFNRGYRSFASVHTDCTTAARTAQARYRSEGATLASEIIARYGN